MRILGVLYGVVVGLIHLAVALSLEPIIETYDYIVVGAGAGGMVVADKLSESGKSVLLIERGPPSTYGWGGRRGPAWLANSELTRFDVPGLCNRIWADSSGIACGDIEIIAGCILGGGTAINSGLWFKPQSRDWDYNFPHKWKYADMAPATRRVFSRIPGTDHPSTDGTLYLQQGYGVISGALLDAGWKSITANSLPNRKNKVFAHTPYMFSHGERGGPLGTYLVSASGRPNFKLWLNTTVTKVIRTGGHITGVQVEPFGDGSHAGVVNVTAKTGRVVLSAGTFGTAKILLRSGIGPTDMLNIVKSSSDGPTMIDPSQWINLPVGRNLNDHCRTEISFSHPNVTFYDFPAAYETPIPADATAYLDHRSGILTQSAPNIGPMLWESILGVDGVTRQLQWTSYAQGLFGDKGNHSMTMSQYIGTGTTSRGRTTITPSLRMVVSTIPYLQSPHDRSAIIQGISHIHDILSKVPGLTWLNPQPGESVEEYVDSYAVSVGSRSGGHWFGSATLGVDDGREGGISVVDPDTKVYGTDNLFVVDASIFPGPVTANPTAQIVIAAERAAELILQLGAYGELK